MRSFIRLARERLGVGGHYRQVQDHGVAYRRNEPMMACREHFGPKMRTLSHENTSSED